ncbi:MAG: hypothetical protein J6U28_08720 [Bacteroidales bacterium]|nr:hypothetical protein [Bacteroidales bacterium]
MKKIIGIIMAAFMSFTMIFDVGVAQAAYPYIDYDPTIKKVIFSTDRRAIGAEEFKDCLQLEKAAVDMQWTKEQYGEKWRELYEHHYNLIPLVSIGEKAFYNCPKLKSFSVPEGCVIGDKALGYFEENGRVQQVPDFVIYGFYNSDAERYARENNFIFHAYEWRVTRGLAGEEDVWKMITPVRKFIPGDVNFDGVVSIEDVQQALAEYVTNLSNGTHGEATVTTDVSGDDIYDVEDVQLMLKYYTVNLSSSTGVTWLDVKNRF